MIVVSDTTPINYLILIEQAEILRDLYGRVCLPQAVFDELRHERAPLEVKEWLKHLPEWLEVRRVTPTPADSSLEELDEGEREAIALAEQMRADALIIDDRAGRREARRRGLRVTGTLGVIEEAARRDLLDLPQTIERLKQTSFYVSPRLLQSLLDRFVQE